MSNDFINAKKLSARITEVEAELAKLLHLKSFLGVPAKRGRKPGTAKAAKAAKAKKTKRGPRGALGSSILKFLSKKGEAGAHAKEIAKAVKSEPKNITAYFYGTGKKVKGVKNLGKNTYSYVPAE